jgi:hypothetical protein
MPEGKEKEFYESRVLDKLGIKKMPGFKPVTGEEKILHTRKNGEVITLKDVEELIHGEVTLGEIQRKFKIGFDAATEILKNYNTAKGIKPEQSPEIGNKNYKEGKNQLVGRTMTQTIANGERIVGVVKCVSSDDVVPSHNPETFAKNPNFPTNPDGTTVNSSDYENSVAKQGEIERVSLNPDDRMVFQLPIVDKRGIVFSGTNRTAGRQLAAIRGTDKKFTAILKENAEMYGINPNEIDKIKNPMFVFELKEEMPYTVENWAKFNKDDKKTQSPIEKAIEIGKIITDRARRLLYGIYETADRMSDVTSNPKKVKELIKLFEEEGILLPNEMPRYFDKKAITSTAEGVALVNNILLGSSLSEGTIRTLDAAQMGDIRNKILDSIIPLIKNSALGKSSLQKNVETAIGIINEAKKTGQSLEGWASQVNMFEVKNFDAADLAVAIKLEGKFKEFIKNYNAHVGQLETDFETGVSKERTKADIIDEVLKQSLDNYEKVKSNITKFGQDGKGQVKPDAPNPQQPIKRSSAEHKQYVHERFRAEFSKKGIPGQQIDAAIAIMEARAKSWASEDILNRTPDEWYDRIADVGGGEFMDGTTKLYQLPDGRTVNGKSVSPEIVNGFYSPLEKVIIDAKYDKLPAKQWVEKFSQLKGEEAKWTGLTDWLQSQPGSVTKADIQNFLKDNRIEIVEVVKGTNDKIGINDLTVQKTASGNWSVYGQENGLSVLFRTVDKSEAKTVNEAKKIVLDEQNEDGFDNTKHSQYQLEGQKENYKEILVTLPKQGKGVDYETLSDKQLAEIYEKNIGYNPFEAGESRDYVIDLLKANAGAKTDVQFVNDTHYSEPNIAVHLRMNTRVGADGKKVLFLDEVQSDWGQKGKKEGFIGGGLKSDDLEIIESKDSGRNNPFLPHLGNTKIFTIFNKRTKLKSIQVAYTEEKAIEKELFDHNQNNIGKKSIQSAPFVTETASWTKLGLKVALKEAVKQGVDKIAWTTGEQQNDRWSLEKQVDYIQYEDGFGGNRYVDISHKDGITTLYVDSKTGKITEEKNQRIGSVGKNLEDVIGKELSERVLTDKKSGRIEGEGLKVGGKGMKGFYGSPTEGKLGIIGEVAEKLFKQKVSTTDIETKDLTSPDQIGIERNGKKWELMIGEPGEEPKLFDTYEKAVEARNKLGKVKQTQHSIDITPELRAEVEKGLPKFQINPEQAGRLKYKSELPTDHIFRDAVETTEGARVTDEGLIIRAIRYQKPDQSGSNSVRTGVFYLPYKSTDVRHYRNGKIGYGGKEKHEGEILIKKPIFVRGATGGKAPQAAYDQIKGKGAYNDMVAKVHDATLSSPFGQWSNRKDIPEDVANLLTRYNEGSYYSDNYDIAYDMVRVSKQGNTLKYAILENIVAHAVRKAGYDSVLGYSQKRNNHYFISEIFDVRETTYPMRGEESEIHPDFKFQEGEGIKKGALETLKDGKYVIHALESPDFSTMVHEIAHVFEGDLNYIERGVVKRIGGSEAFARGFERYLRDGNAPDPEMQSLFDKFKTWLTDIYQSLVGSPIEKSLTPEVKKIFDRLLTERKAIEEEPEDEIKEVKSYGAKTRYKGLEIKVGEKYWDNRYGDFYTIEKMTTFGEDDVTATLKYNKGQTREENGSFLLYHIDAKQHTPFNAGNFGAKPDVQPDVKPKEKITFARNDEKIKKIMGEIDGLLGELGKPVFETGGLSKLQPFVGVIGKLVQVGYYKIEDVAKYLAEKGYNDWLPKLQEAYQIFRDESDLSLEVKNSLSNGKEISGFDYRRFVPGKPNEEGVEAGGNVAGGSVNNGPTGTTGAVRPPIRIADEGSLPSPSKEHIVDGKYDIDENQRFASNLAIDRFKVAKGKSFLLADGAGVGKTRMIEVIANEMSGEGKVLIVSLGNVIEDSFVKDAKALGIDLNKFEIGTYDDLRNGKIGQGEYALAIYDESQNLKNPLSGKAIAQSKVNSKHNMFVSATPMDKPEHAVYFLSEITDIPQKEIQKRLGVEIEWKTKNGETFPIVRIPGGVKEYIVKLLELRKEAITKGAMVRREYPFFGDIGDEKHEMNDKHPYSNPQTVAKIEEIHNDRIDNAMSIVIARTVKDVVMNKFTGLNTSSIQGLSEKDMYAKLKKEYESKSLSQNYWVLHSKIEEFKKQERFTMLANIDKINEVGKFDVVYNKVKKALAAGKQVVVVASYVNKVKVKAGSAGSKYGFYEREIPTEETLIYRVEQALAKEGIGVAKIFGGNKNKAYSREQDKFQSGKAKVLLMTSKSGGTGINLDDVVGNSPREMIIATGEYSGDVLEQVLGRVSRRNTKSPAKVTMVYFPNTSDNNRKKRSDEKRKVIRAIVAGTEDLDKARLEGNTKEDEGVIDEIDGGPVRVPKQPAEKKKPVIEDFGTNGIIVKESFDIKDALKSIGAKWIGSQKGWMLPKTKQEEAQAIIDDFNEGSPEGGVNAMAAGGKTQVRDMNMELDDQTGGKKPVDAMQITKEAEKRFDLKIRKGRMHAGSRTLGIFKPWARVIRTKQHKMLDVLAHEIAHDLDYKFFITKGRASKLTPEMKQELADLDYDPSQKRPLEGFAEYMRLYASGADDSIRLAAPKFMAWFEGTWKPANKEVAENIDWYREQVTQWRMQGARLRALNSIDMMDEGKLTRAYKNTKEFLTSKDKRTEVSLKVASQWKDKLSVIDWVFNRMMQQSGVDFVRPSEHAGQIAASRQKTAALTTNRFVLGGTYNNAFEKTGKSLKEVMSPVTKTKKDFEDAILYAWALRAIDLHNRVDKDNNSTPINTGMPLDEAVHLVDTLYTPERQKFTEELTQFMSMVMDYLVEAGGLSQKAKDRILQQNPSYIMLKKVLDKGTFSGGGGNKIFNVGSPIKSFTHGGSDKNIRMPIKMMIREVESIVNAANSIRVARAFIDFMADKQSHKYGLGNWFEKISSDKKKVQFGIRQIEDQLEKIGADLTDADMESLLDVWVNAGYTQSMKNENIVWIPDPETGKKVFYQVHPLFYEAITKGMRPTHLNWIMTTLLVKPNMMLKLGATAFKVSFAVITNPLRDIPTGGLQSKYKGGGRLDKQLMGIWAETFGTGKYINEFRRSGVEMSNFLGEDIDNMNSLLQEAMLKKKMDPGVTWAATPWEAAKQVADITLQNVGYHIIKHPLKSYREALSITESGVRYAEFDAVMRSYEGRIKAAYQAGDQAEVYKLKRDRAIEATNAANEVTLNFKKAGTYGEVLNMMVPFFNPRLQGTFKMIDMLSKKQQQGIDRKMDSRLRYLLKAISGVTIPTLALWWMNKDDPEYINLAPWRKYLCWNIKLGPNNWISIPRPPEVGLIFGAMPESILNSVYLKDPQYIKEAGIETLYQSFPGIVPGAVVPAAEVYFNYDMFRKQDITHQSLEGLTIDQQVKPYSSEAAKLLSKLLYHIPTERKLNPIEIDHLLSGYSGGLSNDILKLEDLAFDKSGRAPELSNTPIVGKLFIRQDELGAGSKAVKRFQEILKTSDDVTRQINRVIKEEGRVELNLTEAKIKGALNEIGTTVEEYGKWDLTALSEVEIDSVFKAIKAKLPLMTKEQFNSYLIRKNLHQNWEYMKRLGDFKREVIKSNPDSVPEEVKELTNEKINQSYRMAAEKTNELFDALNNKTKNK